MCSVGKTVDDSMCGTLVCLCGGRTLVCCVCVHVCGVTLICTSDKMCTSVSVCGCHIGVYCMCVHEDASPRELET